MSNLMHETYPETPEAVEVPAAAPEPSAAEAPEPAAPNRKTALLMDERGVYHIRTQAEELRVARMLMAAGAVHASLRTEVLVLVAMQAAKSVGLNPYTALRQIGHINGVLTFYGDLELAMVRKSGKLAFKEEFLYVVDKDGAYQRRCFVNANLHLPVAGAVCRMRRVDDDQIEETSFSQQDAERAGLWGKTQTWRHHAGRMMQMRARGLCIRNLFSDVTQGVATQEYDMEGIDYGKGRPVHSHTGEAA